MNWEPRGVIACRQGDGGEALGKPRMTVSRKIKVTPSFAGMRTWRHSSCYGLREGMVFRTETWTTSACSSVPSMRVTPTAVSVIGSPGIHLGLGTKCCPASLLQSCILDRSPPTRTKPAHAKSAVAEILCLFPPFLLWTRLPQCGTREIQHFSGR